MPLRRWRGPQITAKAIEASMVGVDATMAACVTHAKAHHGWQNQTGVLEGSLGVADFAAIVGMLVVGRWGSIAVDYAIFLEFLRGEIMGDTGWTRTRNGAKPYLRPSADAQYPILRARIRAAFQGLALP